MRRSFTATVCFLPSWSCRASTSRGRDLLLWPAAGTGVETRPAVSPGQAPPEHRRVALAPAPALGGHPAALLLLRARAALTATAGGPEAGPRTPGAQGRGAQGLEARDSGVTAVPHPFGQRLGELALGTSAAQPSEHARGPHELLCLFELAQQLVHVLGSGPT